MKEIVRYIQVSLFLAGLAAVLFTYWPVVPLNMRIWLLLMALACEGQLAIWLIRETVRDYPRSSFGQRILPATLPIIVFIAALLRVFAII